MRGCSKFWYIVYPPIATVLRGQLVATCCPQNIRTNTRVCETDFCNETYNLWPELPVKTKTSCESLTWYTPKTKLCDSCSLCLPCQIQQCIQHGKSSQFCWFFMDWCWQRGVKKHGKISILSVIHCSNWNRASDSTHQAGEMHWESTEKRIVDSFLCNAWEGAAWQHFLSLWNWPRANLSPLPKRCCYCRGSHWLSWP